MVKKAASERCKAKTKAKKGHDKGDRYGATARSCTAFSRSNLLSADSGRRHAAARDRIYVGRWGGASRKGWSRRTRLSLAWRWRQASKCLAIAASSWALRGEASLVAAWLKKPAPSSAYQRMLCRRRI
jgi:hypothetical protein